MKNKLIKMLLCVAMVATMVVGCSSNSSDKSDESKSESNVKADAVDKNKVFVTPDWVQSVIDGNQPESENYVILEASWGTYKDSPDYTKGHLPGALHVDIASVESEPYWNLSEPAVIEKGMLDLGVTKDKTVILYGADVSGTARVAYAYLWAGVENVKILNGGLSAWEKAGYKTETDVEKATVATDFGTFTKEIEDNIKECNYEISNIRAELKDVEYIASLMTKLESKILEKSKLSKDRIKAVLKNRNRKVLLFLAYTYQININKFREQYLEDYIMFLSRFTDDLKEDNSKDEPNEDFYILYYESLTTIRHTFDDVMRIAEVTHRDVPERKRNLQSKILDELNNMRELVIKSKSEIFNDDTKQILYGLIEKCESKAIAKMTFTNKEFILIMVALNKEVQCQRAVCVEFKEYIKIKSVEIYECVMRYYQYIGKHPKEILKAEEE